MSLAIVLPSWNTRVLTLRALNSVLASLRTAEEVVVIDDGSSDGSAEAVEARYGDRVRLVRNAHNLGFSAACNLGWRATRSELVLFLNSDTELDPEALGRLAEFLERDPAYDAVAPRLVGPDGATQRGMMDFPALATPLCFGTPLERWRPEARELARYFARSFDYEVDGDVLQPPAACLLVRRSVLEALGGFDERLVLFFSDVDLCLRLNRRGGRTRYLAGGRVLHRLGASTSQRADLLARWHVDRLTYYRLHHGAWSGAWVKTCVAWTYLDFAARSLASRRTAQPALGVATRAFWELLRR